jgi:hypothetical protein
VYPSFPARRPSDGRIYGKRRSNMNTKSKLLVGSGFALALALATWSPLQAQSADSADAAKPTESQLAEHCREMKDQRLQIRADIKAQDARLTDRLAELNGAADERKVGLMAALLTSVVEQRIAMDVRRTKLDDGMMHHWMQHLQLGKDSMSKCPMCAGEAKSSADPK